MKPFISPFGIVLMLPFYWLCFVAIRRLWRRLGKSPRRRGLLLLAPPILVLPYADELWIAWHFERACRDAGVAVYRRVEVEGYANATGGAHHHRNDSKVPRRIYNDEKSLEDWDKTGYRFKEQLLSDGWALHLERRADGVYAHYVDKPQARYQYRYADPRQWVPAGYQMNRLERQVVDSETGEVLGREVLFERYPGFVEGLWIRFLGSGQTICEGNAPRPPELRHLLYHYVLIPKKSN